MRHTVFIIINASYHVTASAHCLENRIDSYDDYQHFYPDIDLPPFRLSGPRSDCSGGTPLGTDLQI